MKKLIKQIMNVFAILAVAGSTLVGTGPSASAQSLDFPDVPRTHWAYNMVHWSAEHGITDGYPDGTFRPSKAVTEAELLGMLLRAFPEIAVDELQKGQSWYEPYYKLAREVDWPVQYEPAQHTTRGQVARLLAAILGQPKLTESQAIQLMLEQGIAQGKHGTGIASFAPQDTLTRAEAQTLLYRLKQKLPKVTNPVLVQPNIMLQGIALGDSEERLIQALGQPDRKDYINDKMQGYIYNQDYKRYAQIAVADDKVVGLFSNGEGWQFEEGDSQGLRGLADRAEQLWGKMAPTNHVTIYNLAKSELHLYLDSHEDDRVDGVLLLDKAYVDSYRTAKSSAEWLSAQELEIFDLTNAFRVQKGLQPLSWNKQAATAAQLHAQDMADRNYFEHDNPEGQSPGQRLAEQGLVKFQAWGENIAAGQDSGIGAHYAWLNSLGHRENMLKSRFTTLGVGVRISDKPNDYGKYYVQNFYTPR